MCMHRGDGGKIEPLAKSGVQRERENVQSFGSGHSKDDKTSLMMSIWSNCLTALRRPVLMPRKTDQKGGCGARLSHMYLHEK